MSSAAGIILVYQSTVAALKIGKTLLPQLKELHFERQAEKQLCMGAACEESSFTSW